MNFYESLGFLVLGSRLRRLSENFLSDVNRVYAEHQLKFDASWFPVFYILSKQKQVSIRYIADELAVSHSAISQLVSSLQEKGLLKTTASAEDGRKKVVTFTAKGQKLQQQIEPVWNALSKAMEELAKEGNHSKHFLKAIGELETGLTSASLFERVEKHLDQ
ncbi:MarR family winged helix-turn-helix transcriptional regulator [Pseudoflavitalea rhizosphaerae]|uniref:MarR family winged helix-turn-helix transcriptional regulator n=1 Tax=Pseudoflavitalea rhizosphaerae TaxID=1884793 RepID=UPI000F8CCD02|nr:helix-turn-helix domain-containing protein [Pseudoflavitalea rhizosphaerae]